MAARPYNVPSIQVYSLTSVHSDKEVKMFYEQLEQTIKKDFFAMVGDFKAKVGPDAY